MIRFVTAARSRSGVTLVCALLARTDTAAGRRVAYLKAVQTARDRDEPGDARYVEEAARVPAGEGTRYSSALPPAVAAELAAAQLGVDWLVRRARLQAGTLDVLYVEGAGGFLMPLSGSQTMADLAVGLAAEVVVVVESGPDALGDAAFVLDTLRHRALTFGGFVLNRWPRRTGVGERATLARLSALGPILGSVHDCDGLDTTRPGKLPDGCRLIPLAELSP